MIRVLGPIQIVTAEARTIDLPGVSQRRLLAVLALHAPSPVRAERLAEVLQVSSSGLRTGVTRLRKVGRAVHGTQRAGYRSRRQYDALTPARSVTRRRVCATAPRHR
jgi:biotin operon repressor